ncbi:biotin carboxylase N-terminal domain-containing protein [Candidatus Uabimicrobium amorphum]|uniref:Biotin carboxylase n=1 Tax=Uabimicrobium amorphum TaxID=2596890 RepID=A0A5S9F2B6_UABAM|nr:biotin carboxylase N-terminal domain-containing protein [Candidatus Uabimicrobium amorphum]BBM83497.1 biotin carboxylase [Candidatus Uabimicrobium amorphum]
MKILIICRGPIADEALRVISETSLPRPHILISRREWLDHLETQAPWLYNWSRFAQIHLVDEYSDMDAIIKIVQENGLDAVYPGYGFLAENPVFAGKCEKAGIRFIGPSSETLELMGLKDRARCICKEIGVPVTPGIDSLERVILEKNEGEWRENLGKILREKGIDCEVAEEFSQAIDKAYDAAAQQHIDLFSEDELIGAAKHAIDDLWKKHEMPIRIKASAGGGGKGQRVVTSDSDIAKAMREVWNEVGDNSKSVILEANIEGPRHMEVQILGDGEDVIHFAVRDCSLQTMFYQKLIEIGVHEGQIDTLLAQESAGSEMYKELEAEKQLIANLQNAAVKICKHIGYQNAGTVEFLVDKNRNFYFMEVNARIQVEHGVSEEISYVKGQKPRLISEQIRIASGEKLGYTQQDIAFRGYALELRISLLDSFSLQPAPGAVIEKFFFDDNECVRVEDSGIAASLRQHRVVMSPPQYDANIVLNIYRGEDYGVMLENAVDNLQNAMIEGRDLHTTIPFHMAVLSWLRANQPLPHVTTDFVEIHLCLLRLYHKNIKELHEEVLTMCKKERRNPFALLSWVRQVTTRLMEDPSHIIAFFTQRNTFRDVFQFVKSTSEWLGISLWNEDSEYLESCESFYKNLCSLTEDSLPMEDLHGENPTDSWQETVSLIAQIEQKSTQEVWDKLQGRHKSIEESATFALLKKLQSTLLNVAHKDLYKLPEKTEIHVPESVRSKEERRTILHATTVQKQDDNHIVSPTLGVFYASPKPGEPHFVEVGQQVKVGQTMFLVGAMKVYTEVQSPRSGVIKEIRVEDGTLVKQGEVVMIIE